MKAAIFDLDGTLIDSRTLHFQAFQDVVKEKYGIEFPWERLEENYGKTSEEIIRPFLAENDLDVQTSTDFAQQRRERLWKNMEGLEYIETLKGARTLLEGLRLTGTRLALATGNTRESGELLVEKAGLKKYFPVRVYRDDVENNKPAPDIFLAAAKKLEAPPDDCIVFEDSVSGVTAAVASGMTVVAVSPGPKLYPEIARLNPHHILDSLTEFDYKLLEK